MFSIIGILVVIGAIMGGYLMEHGKRVLMQPAELLIIGGAGRAPFSLPTRFTFSRKLSVASAELLPAPSSPASATSKL